MVLGAGAELGIAISSLILHEFSHALMARALNVRVLEIELMPLGGAARMENIYQARPAQLVWIALAGPLTNLAIILFASAMAWFSAMGPYTAMLFIKINLVLMLFNLLPALPLDGGRIFAALMGKLIGVNRALRIFVMLGYIISGLLLALAAFVWLNNGLINLTLIFAPLFLILSGKRELDLATGATLLSLMRRQDELANEGTLPLRYIAASATSTASSILPRLQSRSLHRIAVYSSELRYLGTIEERDLIAPTYAGETLEKIVTQSPNKTAIST